MLWSPFDEPRFPEAAPHTQRVYRAQWRLFSEWTLRQGTGRLPASPDTVARYLVDRDRRGASLSTIRASATAIAAVHRLWGFRIPTYTPTVQSTLQQLAHRHRRPAVSAQPLTDRAVNAIESAALTRRIGRGGFREKCSTARRRGRLDIAMIRLMSDASLGRSEAAALVWGDITPLPEGRGLIRIRRAYASAGRSYEKIPISRDTMRAIRAIRSKTVTPDMPVFGLSESQVHRRIKAAASAAGRGDGFGGDSGRAAARRTRKTRPPRERLTLLETYLESLTTNEPVFEPTDMVERRNRSVRRPFFEPGQRATWPRADVDATLPEEYVPQRPEYPNASPEG